MSTEGIPLLEQDTIPIRHILVALAQDGTILGINRECEQSLGYAEDELNGKNLIDTLIHVDDRALARRILHSLRENKASRGLELRWLTKSGEARAVSLDFWPLSGCGCQTVICSALDVTGLMSSNNARTREIGPNDALRFLDMFRELVEESPDVIYRVSLNEEPFVEYISPSIANITGFFPADFYAKPSFFLDITHPTDRQTFCLLLTNRNWQKRTVQLRIMHRDGRTVWTEHVLLQNSEGKSRSIYGIARDITDRKVLEQQVLFMATHDPLTGATTRNSLTAEIQSMGAENYPVTLFSADVDGLKLANDTMGHRYGDSLLVTLVDVLRSVFPSSSLIARMGGDEFSVAVPNCDISMADALCDQLGRELERVNSQGRGFPLHASIGYHVIGSPNEPLDEAFRAADAAMYTEKLSRFTSSRRGVVEALRAALHVRDVETEEHTARVVNLSIALGKALKLDKRTLDELKLLAETHDIGKIAIPDAILLKTTPLSDDERKKIESHSLVGFRIASSCPDLAGIASLILHHHEWWNGKGYPRGLSGEDIPIHCRVLAIADAYDAMTSKRCYKPPLSKSQALEEIRRCSGTQFDPYLAEKFIEVVENSEI